MDDFIGDLISAILEVIFGPILGAIQAKVRRSVGCFMWYAAIIFCFGLLLGGFSGYGVNHSSPLGWLIGGVVGGAVVGAILLRLARRSVWWPNRPRRHTLKTIRWLALAGITGPILFAALIALADIVQYTFLVTHGYTR